MKIYLILILLANSLLGCTSLETAKVPFVLDMKEMEEAALFYKIPVIIDTTNLDTISIEDKQPPYVYYRQVLYSGINKDTIYLPDSNRAEYLYQSVKWKEINSSMSKKTNIRDSLAVNLFIETKRIVYEKIPFFHINENDYPNLKPLEVQYEIHKNYPLIIYNNTSDTLKWIDVLPITIEAKDKEGIWQIIQKTRGSTCGEGTIAVSFPKKQILISSIPIYKGNFTTKLRVRLGKNISNEYTGQINLEQFEKIQY